MRTFDEHLDQVLQDPDVQAGFNEQAVAAQLGGLLRTARVRARLSQQKLAQLTGLSQADVSRLESGFGKKGPTIDTLVRCARAQRMRLVIQFVPTKRAAKKVVQKPARRKRAAKVVQKPALQKSAPLRLAF
jgi:transcriptional regulator with XRE-family HTH domain